jgi:hypothetical protein
MRATKVFLSSASKLATMSGAWAASERRAASKGAIAAAGGFLQNFGF